MNKPKPNITLLNISDFKTSGICLSLKKGFNEIFRKSNNTFNKTITPVKVKSSYREMLSVIICTTREPQYTAAVIDSLDITNTNYETEIIVVNNTNREFNLTDIYKSTKIINEPILGLSKSKKSRCGRGRRRVPVLYGR